MNTPHKNNTVYGRIVRTIEAINTQINMQLNNIIHCEKFQQLESSWRNIHRICIEVSHLDNPNIMLKLLDVSFEELHLDLTNQSEDFESTLFFKRVYSDEFDRAGGTPYSIILGDYELKKKSLRSVNTANCISILSQIASLAFCPLIFGLSSNALELENWSEIKAHNDYREIYDSIIQWTEMRAYSESQFTGLVAPGFKVRTPYQISEYAHRNYFFTEEINRHEHILWGNPGYRYISAIIYSFNETGWFLNIHQPIPSNESLNNTDDNKREFELSHRTNNELYVTEKIEDTFNNLGIIALNEKKIHSLQYFGFQPSIYNGVKETHKIGNQASWQIQIPYLLCACRIAQTLKIISRDKIGSFTDREECEQWMNAWLLTFCSSEFTPNEQIHLKYPLSEAKAYVRDSSDTPGVYLCELIIKPHSLLENSDTKLVLHSKIRKKGPKLC